MLRNREATREPCIQKYIEYDEYMHSVSFGQMVRVSNAPSRFYHMIGRAYLLSIGGV